MPEIPAHINLPAVAMMYRIGSGCWSHWV